MKVATAPHAKRSGPRKAQGWEALRERRQLQGFARGRRAPHREAR
jgi:hypothetical protein